MGSDDVFAITSRGDDIWFGNYAGGINHLASDGSITRYTHDEDDPDSLPSDTVWPLAFDSNGTLWMGTLSGLAKFQDGRTQRVALTVDSTSRHYSTVPVGAAHSVCNAPGVQVRAAEGHT